MISGVEDRQKHGGSENLHEEHRLVPEDKSSADIGEESEDEESDGESQNVHLNKIWVSRRKTANTKSVSVKWSNTDTSIVREAFRDFVYVENDQKNCRGSLPSKENIVKFVRENQLESLSKLSEKEKYLKIRAKVFNERKTAREKTCKAMKKMAVKKT